MANTVAPEHGHMEEVTNNKLCALQEIEKGLVFGKFDDGEGSRVQWFNQIIMYFSKRPQELEERSHTCITVLTGGRYLSDVMEKSELKSYADELADFMHENHQKNRRIAFFNFDAGDEADEGGPNQWMLNSIIIADLLQKPSNELQKNGSGFIIHTDGNLYVRSLHEGHLPEFEYNLSSRIAYLDGIRIPEGTAKDFLTKILHVLKDTPPNVSISGTTFPSAVVSERVQKYAAIERQSFSERCSECDFYHIPIWDYHLPDKYELAMFFRRMLFYKQGKIQKNEFATFFMRMLFNQQEEKQKNTMLVLHCGEGTGRSGFFAVAAALFDLSWQDKEKLETRALDILNDIDKFKNFYNQVYEVGFKEVCKAETGDVRVQAIIDIYKTALAMVIRPKKRNLSFLNDSISDNNENYKARDASRQRTSGLVAGASVDHTITMPHQFPGPPQKASSFPPWKSSGTCCKPARPRPPAHNP